MGKILLVNDSTTLTKVLTMHFRAAGYKVFAVSTAMDAYQAFIRYSPDLILTDYVLPDQDGIAVVETFRASAAHKSVPIVVFTAMDDDEVKERCRAAGTSLVIRKTSDFRGMLASIDNLVEEHKSNQPMNTIDQDLGHCIVRATVDVYKTMLNMKITPGEIKVEKVQSREAEVIASIGVAGFLSGSISMFMSHDLATSAVRNMLMMEPDEAVDKDELIDATGEIINMVGGSIKTGLFAKTPLFDISVPSVYVGRELERRSISNDLCFMVPFEYKGTSLLVEFLMVTKTGAETTGVQNALIDSMK